MEKLQEEINWIVIRDNARINTKFLLEAQAEFDYFINYGYFKRDVDYLGWITEVLQDKWEWYTSTN